MKLMAGTLRPGTVLKVEDGGVIKASAPGLFSAEDDVELLPPIYPSFIGNSNQYSQPEEYDEVWILQFSDNPLELHWIKKDAQDVNNEELGLGEETDVEILCNRKSGMGIAAVYFSNGTGWVMTKDNSKIQINHDGDIILSTGLPHGTLAVTGSGISLGTEGKSKYSAVLGEPLVDCLNEFLSALAKIGKTASANPYTAPIGALLLSLPAQLAQSVNSVLSSNVTLD